MNKSNAEFQLANQTCERLNFTSEKTSLENKLWPQWVPRTS